jgi:hypothetical protein
MTQLTKNTSGFYQAAGKHLAFAPNKVMAPDYTLDRADKDSYSYPAHGWYWFDTEEQAREFFGLPVNQNQS